MACSCVPSELDPLVKKCMRKSNGFMFDCDPKECSPMCNAEPIFPFKQLNPAGIPIMNAPLETDTGSAIRTVSDDEPFSKLGSPFAEGLSKPKRQFLSDVLLMGEKIKPGSFLMQDYLKLLVILVVLFVISTVIVFA